MNPSVNEIRRRQNPDTFQQEVAWFAKGFRQPKTRLEISASTIDAFQTMIWDKPGDDILPTFGLTPDELSRLAASGTRGWLATDHVTWVLSELNTMQQDTLLLCPNAVVNITNEMARKKKIFNFGMVKRLVLPLNVGKENGQTFIGTMNKSGNHWVRVVVEIRPFKRILYCDTLAWKPPSDIIDVVNSYISHIPRIGKYDDTHLFLAHQPMATSRFGHMCDWRCRNYPLQTCSDVYGVIVLIIAALAALDRSLFQFLIGPSEKSQVYLQRPSQQAYFLRRIIMCWFAESRIEINYVLLHHDWRDNVRTESDHSSCLRRDTSSSSRKKLKLSLNPKASSSNGSIPRATEEHASAKECSSPSPAEDFPINNAQVSNGSSSIPNSPMSSEETFSPPPKTPSSPNDSRAVPSCKKGSQSSSGKPPKVPRSSADHLSSAKKPQPFTRPDPTSPAQNNNPRACPQANPSEKSVSNSQPSPSTGPPAQAPASTQPTSQATIASDSSNADSADSVPPPNCEGMTRFQCEHCGMNLSSRNCLYKHKKRKHKPTNRVDDNGGKDAGNKHVVCPECKEKQKRSAFATTGDLIHHLNNHHGHDLKIESMTFKDMTEFEKWKNEEERMTKSWYVKNRADRKTKHYTKSWLRCNRTGTFVSKSTGKRAMKSQGSCKTGCSCPAFITTRRYHATGEVQAEFCLKHVGHRQENAFNRMSKEMRTTIAAKLSQGISMTSVMDYIRDSMCGPLNRDHLITRADLHNIKQQYNINCMQKASDDADSVLYWVQEMQCEEFNPVLFFKPQGQKSDFNGVEEKDFLLALQTQFQKEMFEKHAQKLICVDATHGTTAYDFQLVTVLVIDDYNEGIPVAWLISNKETTDALKIFFSSLRERCGEVQTETFMSDDADAYYNAWVSTFSRPDRKLLCSWHVDRSWRRKLNEHLKDKEQMAEVYAALKSLQNELSETSFRRSLQQFMAWIKGKSEPLAKYFEKEYVGRTREWAACFRVGSRANTNMFVERFHRTLKEVYLEKKQNRRVDHLIFKLRKISRDKAFEQLIKAEKGKNTVRQRESIKRHKQGESVKKEAVHKQDENFWNVQSASNEQTVHHVRRISSGCSCLLNCPSCDACIHTFECSCADYSIRRVLCSHIHSVNILYPKTTAADLDFLGTELETTSDIDIEKKREELSNIIQQDKQLQESKQLADLKTYALNQIAELSDLIQSAPTKDTINTTLKHIRSAISVAKGLSVIGSDHQYLKTQLFPANKLYEKQKRFFSTKKKRKVHRERANLSDATAKELEDMEVQVCAFCFKENPPGEDKDTFEWIECEKCQCWVHEVCDYIDDKANYICCMCRS